jgi:hypothetical protein
VLQGYFRLEGFRLQTRSSTIALPGMALPAGPGRTGGSALAQLQATRMPGPPRPDLLPVAMRGPTPALVQAKPASAEQIRTTRLVPGQVRLVGDGAPLAPDLRAPLEKFFQVDLSTVRIHEGPAANAIGAAAFTLGEHVYFAARQFAPRTPAGLELLGHELTHVIQQRRGQVQSPFSDGIAVVQDPALEAQADEAGRRLREASGRLRTTSVACRFPPPPPPPGAAAWLGDLTSVAQLAEAKDKKAKKPKKPKAKGAGAGAGAGAAAGAGGFHGGPVPGTGTKPKRVDKAASYKRATGAVGVSATSYYWHDNKWKGSSGPKGELGGEHAEQRAYEKNKASDWVGIIQNAFPCAERCIPFFDNASKGRHNGGIVFNITDNKYNQDWNGQEAPCSIYFVDGKHAVRGPDKKAGEPDPPK